MVVNANELGLHDGEEIQQDSRPLPEGHSLLNAGASLAISHEQLAGARREGRSVQGKSRIFCSHFVDYHKDDIFRSSDRETTEK